MAIRTVLVCGVQVPLVHGGAEMLVDQLVAQLQARGYDAEAVRLPFKWYPKAQIFNHAAAWRLLDLTESSGRAIDCVIATKFPSYFVQHPNKAVWLVHQHRAAYDLCGSSYCLDFAYDEIDVATRERLIDLDSRALRESKRLFTIGQVVSDRLSRFNGIEAPALHHPPRLAGRLRPGQHGDYLLSVGRLETLKRVDLAMRALARAPRRLSLVVAGEGTQRDALGALAEELGMEDRVRFAGNVSDEELIELYSGSLAVVFAPFDEDYGYVTLEAFLSGKPVVTASDSGGVLEFVVDGVSGRVCDPEPDALAAAFAELEASPSKAGSMGEAGRQRALMVSWDGVIERLVGE